MLSCILRFPSVFVHSFWVRRHLTLMCGWDVFNCVLSVFDMLLNLFELRPKTISSRSVSCVQHASQRLITQSFANFARHKCLRKSKSSICHRNRCDIFVVRVWKMVLPGIRAQSMPWIPLARRLSVNRQQWRLICSVINWLARTGAGNPSAIKSPTEETGYLAYSNCFYVWLTRIWIFIWTNILW